ncbi:terminase large subunit domain-containing protein [Thalassoroseus pseudoceratinae]|uniref:terminase large subunit domain-containing protein n=1 Tax=Thalassoroseus pseudoceratinae TaxID=2713176 RepID=UPI00142136B6|nr:terminase large subunit [Thalassoroseus pseudoceratinae]
MNLREIQQSPAAFRRAIKIDTDRHGVAPLADCLDDWQEADFQALDNGWRRAAGQKVEQATQRAWLERGRGHSKTSDLAVMATWTLFASRKRLSGIAAAGDKDQAALLRTAIARLLDCNPWLSGLIEIQSSRIINTGTKSELEIISSDAATSYGLTPDFVIADEVCHWAKRDLWDSLLSSSAKRSTCMFVVITNAGLMDDWVWETREKVRTDPAWHFSRLDGPVASWINQDLLAEQERLLPSIAFTRLWLNEWTSGGGDALSRADIEAAFDKNLSLMPAKESGYQYVAGLDLGVSRDASAICVLAIKGRQRWDKTRSDHGEIRLAYTQLWKPNRGEKINLSQVESALVKLHSKYDFESVMYDPWQATHMSQRLELRRLPMVELTQSGTNLQRVATTVIEAFNDRRLRLYPEPELKRDLIRLRVEERSYGFRLVSPRDGTGHGDLASAFGYAMVGANDLAGRIRKGQAGVIDLYAPQEVDADDDVPYWAKDFESRRLQFEADQRMFREPDDDDAELRLAMRLASGGRRG